MAQENRLNYTSLNKPVHYAAAYGMNWHLEYYRNRLSATN